MLKFTRLVSVALVAAMILITSSAAFAQSSGGGGGAALITTTGGITTTAGLAALTVMAVGGGGICFERDIYSAERSRPPAGYDHWRRRVNRRPRRSFQVSQENIPVFAAAIRAHRDELLPLTNVDKLDAERADRFFETVVAAMQEDVRLRRELAEISIFV